jgi:phage terminase large subunit-like protein
MEWSTALPDWERRIVAGESLIPFLPMFPDQAEEGLRIFGELRAVDVADGSLTLGQISRRWILDLVAAIFGSYDPETGRRLIREIFLLISKKNGKSTDAAGIMLTALLLNWRQSGEMGILAPTIEVANNAWRPARDAIRADEELSDLLQVQDHVRTITHRETGATLQVVAADSEAVAGKKWIVTLVDELWLFGKRPTAAKMLLEATGGMASRPEGFVMYSSTQSDEPPAGVFQQKLQYARDVRDGKVHDPAFLPVLYEFPRHMVESGAARDPKNFCITNPNLGASVDEEFLRRGMAQAENDGQQAVRDFLAKHLNVEIGLNLRSDRWTGAEFWEQQARTGLTLAEVLDRSEVATVGIDGGGLDDLLGLAVLGRERGTGEWLLWNHAWAHPIAIERRQSEESKYRDFEKDGDLTIIEALPGDVSEVAAVVAQVLASGLLASVGMDPEKTHKIMFQALVDLGVDEKLCFGISQGWKLVGAISVAERKLAEKKMVHGGTRLMNWSVGNAKVEPRGNASLITKQASGTAKIDPLMATFNAVALMALNPTAAGARKSFWDTEENDA